MLVDHLCKWRLQKLSPRLHVLAIAKKEIVYNFAEKMFAKKMVGSIVSALSVGPCSKMVHEGVR